MTTPPGTARRTCRLVAEHSAARCIKQTSLFLLCACCTWASQGESWPDSLPRIAPPKQRPTAVVALPTYGWPGQLLTGHVPPGSHITYQDTQLPVGPQGEVTWRIPQTSQKRLVLHIVRPNRSPLRWQLRVIATPESAPVPAKQPCSPPSRCRSNNSAG